MPTVTAITQQQKNKERFNLFLDDEFCCGVTADLMLSYGLHKGLELTPAEVERLQADSEEAKMYFRVLDLIARRPRSENEVRIYILDKGRKYNLENLSDSATSIIERLRKVSYVNDAEFARWWIEQRTQRRQPFGFLRISSELQQKGVGRSLIQKVWEEQHIDEEALLESQWEDVKAKYNLDDQKERSKAVKYLQRRGFRWEHIKSMLK